MKITIYTSIFLTALSFNNPVLANQFYKWVDDNGVTHYSQRPPHQKSATEVKTRSQTSTQKQTQQAAEQNTKTQAKAKKEAPKEEVAEKKQELKKDQALCKKAQNELAMLKRTPVVRQKGKVMSIADKNKAIANLRDIIKVHC